MYAYTLWNIAQPLVCCVHADVAETLWLLFLPSLEKVQVLGSCAYLSIRTVSNSSAEGDPPTKPQQQQGTWYPVCLSGSRLRSTATLRHAHSNRVLLPPRYPAPHYVALLSSPLAAASFCSNPSTCSLVPGVTINASLSTFSVSCFFSSIRPATIAPSLAAFT